MRLEMKAQSDSKLIRTFLIILIVLFIITIAATVGLVYCVVNLSKDVTLSDQQVMMAKGTSTPIGTSMLQVSTHLDILYLLPIQDLETVKTIVVPFGNGQYIAQVASIYVIQNQSAVIKTMDMSVIYPTLLDSAKSKLLHQQQQEKLPTLPPPLLLLWSTLPLQAKGSF